MAKKKESLQSDICEWCNKKIEEKYRCLVIWRNHKYGFDNEVVDVNCIQKIIKEYYDDIADIRFFAK